MTTPRNCPAWACVFLLVLIVCCTSTVLEAHPARIARALFVAQADTVETPADSTEADDDAKKDLPLKGARTVAFSTDEASWMSVDIHPDGALLVLDVLGDLYTLPSAGGAATRFTSGMAYDSQPRFSPDGKHVVFVSDRDGGENIWMQSLDGQDTLQVTKGKNNLYHSPEWTPDGQYIVATKSNGLGPGRLWLFHRDGGSGTALVKEPQTLRMSGAAFGSDPRYVWYATRTGGWQYNAQLPQYQLAIYDRESGKRYTQTNHYGSAFRPTLSSDGQWVAFGNRHEEHTGLRLRNLQTGDEQWLAYPVQRDDQESRATMDVLPGMTFTPDNQAVLASYGGKLWRIPVDGTAAAEIPFTLDVDLELGAELDFNYPITDSLSFTAKQIRDAVPSPDGTRLAFTALDRLWVMAFPDGTPRRVTTTNMGEFQPTWSPDGQWIGYVTWSGDAGHIYKTRANGQGQPVQLTDTPAYYRNPAWSPDGTRLVMVRSGAQAFREDVGFVVTGGPGAELVWVPAAGGSVTRIAPTEGRGNPHFTENPDRIYFSGTAEGLISMRWDGTDQKAHVKVTGKTMPGAEQPQRAGFIRMAPKGDQALAQVVNDLYVVTVPYVGGDTPTISIANPESAPFPARKLTVVGGQFPNWSADGRKVHWSIGNAHVVYDLDAAKAAEDSAKAAAKAPADTTETASADSTATDSTTVDAKEDKKKDKKKPVYEPKEIRIAIPARRDIPQGRVVLRGARVITMKGDEVLENADIVITNNRITDIGPGGSVTVPDGAEVIDVSGKTIIPGFIDTHAHMWPAWNIHQTQIWQYLANLAYGVTTTRDPQTATTDVLSYADQVQTGALTGPRIYYTGPGVFGAEQVKDADHARDVLKRYSKYYDSKTIKQYVAGNRQQRQWIIMAAQEQNLMPTTEGALDFKLNMTQIIDGYPGHEHSFPIYPLYKDVIELVAQSRTVYTPTLLVSYGGPWAENYYYTTEEVHDDPKLRHFTPHGEIDSKTLRRPWFRNEQHVFQDHARFVKDLVEAGGRAGVGSHGQLQGLGYHWELWAMQSGGLSTHDALKVATLHGAEAIGLDTDLGSLEVGKLADLIVLDANPLDNIRNTNTITHVMKNGRLYLGDSLDEVWPRQQAMPDLWWADVDPNGVPGMPQE